MFGRRNKEEQPQPAQPEQGCCSPDSPCCQGGAAPDPSTSAGADDQLSRLAAERDEALRQRDEAVTNWKRALADFQNFQRRAAQNEQEARRQGLSSVLHTVIPVLDHFDMALTLDPAKATAEQVIEGVQVIRNELLKALELHGVKLISPAPNDTFEPGRHEAIMTQAPGPDLKVEPGHVVSTFQIGYALGDRVIRPAKVAVAPTA